MTIAKGMNMVLRLDDETRARLRRFIEDEGPKIEARNDAVRAGGAGARAMGVPIEDCPYHICSAMSRLWFEGWSGTRAPERDVLPSGGFNMTPQEHVAAYADWVVSLNLPDNRSLMMVLACRRSYAPDALVRVQ